MIGHAINGFPLKNLTFFPGKPLEPPLAGIIQIVLSFFSFLYDYIKLVKTQRHMALI